MNQAETSVDAALRFLTWSTLEEIAERAELSVKEVKPVLAALIAKDVVEKSGEKYRYRND